MINRWRIGLDRSKFALLKNSLLSKNLTNFPRFPLFSSLRVCKKVRFFVHFSLLLIYYFFFSKLIFRHRTDYVEVWNTFFAAHESKICRVSMISKFNATEKNGCNAMNSRFSNSFALESLLYTNSRIFRFRRWKYRLIFV